jgi:hypothetical protein
VSFQFEVNDPNVNIGIVQVWFFQDDVKQFQNGLNFGIKDGVLSAIAIDVSNFFTVLGL